MNQSTNVFVTPRVKNSVNIRDIAVLWRCPYILWLGVRDISSYPI